MAELLIEILCEEIPASLQKKALDECKRHFEYFLKSGGTTKESGGISHGAIEVFITPRRLVFWADGISSVQPDSMDVYDGPRVDAPLAAVEGFFSKWQRASSCTRQKKETPKGLIWQAEVCRKAIPIPRQIGVFLDHFFATASWSKYMRWDDSSLKWIRPIRSVFCMFDGKPVAWDLPSKHHIVLASTVKGHRFLAPHPFSVTSVEEYLLLMENAFVIVDQKKRAFLIEQGIKAKAREKGLEVFEEDFLPGGLLEEVTGLVEWPVVFLGTINPSFLDLPAEVMAAPMRLHQRYFPLRDVQTKKIAPFFAFVANIAPQDKGKRIVSGNERVLQARLSDAHYFWQEDQKHGLDHFNGLLSKRMVFEGLGSFDQKSKRLEGAACAWQPHHKELRQSAGFCKADLATQMVGEFPELQGIMGKYYGKIDGLCATTARAIEEHHWPQGEREWANKTPVSSTGLDLGIIDRIDTLMGFYLTKGLPHSSKDPLGIRRAATGLAVLLLSSSKEIRWDFLCEKIFSLYQDQGFFLDTTPSFDGLWAFLSDRIRYILHAIYHIPFYVSSSFFDGPLFHHPQFRFYFFLYPLYMKGVLSFLHQKEGRVLLQAFKRTASFLRRQEDLDLLGAVDPLLFETKEEQAVFDAFYKRQPLANKLLEAFLKEPDSFHTTLQGHLQDLSCVSVVMEDFFQHVRIRGGDKALEMNRLGLVKRADSAFKELGNLVAMDV